MTHPITYLHHLEATGGGTLRYIEYLFQAPSPEVGFLLFDRGEADLSRLAHHPNVRVLKAPRHIIPRAVVVLWETIRAIRRLRPTHVHAHSSISGFVVRLLKPLFGFTCIYTPHCYSFTYPARFGLGVLYRVVERALAAATDLALHVSLADYMVGKQLSVRPRAMVIRSPYDWTKPRVDPRATFESSTVLLVGGNRRQKGYGVLEEIAQGVRGCGLRLRVVGCDRFSDAVDCMPWQEDLSECYASSFCMLNVSYSEGLSLSMIDALYVGVPVVAFDIPANREILDGGCGVLIEQRSVGDLVSALTGLKQSFERYHMLHANGQRRAEREFGPKRFFQAYARHYERCGVTQVAIPGRGAGTFVACPMNHETIVLAQRR